METTDSLLTHPTPLKKRTTTHTTQPPLPQKSRRASPFPPGRHPLLGKAAGGSRRRLPPAARRRRAPGDAAGAGAGTGTGTGARTGAGAGLGAGAGVGAGLGVALAPVTPWAQRCWRRSAACPAPAPLPRPALPGRRGGGTGGVLALIPTACPAGGPLPAPSRAERALCWRRRSAPHRAGHGQGERGRPGQRSHRHNGEPRGARLGHRKRLRERNGRPGEAAGRAPGVPAVLRGAGAGGCAEGCPEAPQHRRQERARGRGKCPSVRAGRRPAGREGC